MDFSQQPVGDEQLSTLAKRVLPDLSPLVKNLRSLSLAHNRFTRVPASLAKLTTLEVLDLSRECSGCGVFVLGLLVCSRCIHGAHMFHLERITTLEVLDLSRECKGSCVSAFSHDLITHAI